MQFHSTCHGDFADLRRELSQDDQDAIEIAILRGRCSFLFERANELKRSQRSFNLEALSSYRCDHIADADRQRFTIFMDHEQWFVDLDGNPQALVIHPYGHNLSKLASLMNECAEAYGVKAHIPDRRDSWYWPGKTSVYAFTRSQVSLRWPNEFGDETET